MGSSRGSSSGQRSKGCVDLSLPPDKSRRRRVLTSVPSYLPFRIDLPHRCRRRFAPSRRLHPAATSALSSSGLQIQAYPLVNNTLSSAQRRLETYSLSRRLYHRLFDLSASLLSALRPLQERFEDELDLVDGYANCTLDYLERKVEKVKPQTLEGVPEKGREQLQVRSRFLSFPSLTSFLSAALLKPLS